jgi:monofunctional biosynthetic peptidoglycan transglycosylase
MRKFWRYAWRGLALFTVIVLVYQLWIFVHVVAWIWVNPSSSSFMDDRRQILQEKNPEAELKHQWVPYAKISVSLKRAIVAAEDSKFLDHDGFDWEALQKAYEKNLKKGRIVAGGSTISQQLAKNLFLSSKKTPWRKLQEAVITLMLEGVMDKRRILEIYLNVIEWGNGVFGAEAAARHYYGVSAAQLGPEQSARLAAYLPAPKRYGRIRSGPYLDSRSSAILRYMPDAVLP